MSRLHRQKIKQRRHDENQVDRTEEVAAIAPTPVVELPARGGIFDSSSEEAYDEGFAAGLVAGKKTAKKKKTGARSKRSSSKARG